jgi:hypothetical protein
MKTRCASILFFAVFLTLPSSAVAQSNALPPALARSSVGFSQSAVIGNCGGPAAGKQPGKLYGKLCQLRGDVNSRRFQ